MKDFRRCTPADAGARSREYPLRVASSTQSSSDANALALRRGSVALLKSCHLQPSEKRVNNQPFMESSLGTEEVGLARQHSSFSFAAIGRARDCP
jgi:hypothetical protein